MEFLRDDSVPLVNLSRKLTSGEGFGELLMHLRTAFPFKIIDFVGHFFIIDHVDIRSNLKKPERNFWFYELNDNQAIKSSLCAQSEPNLQCFETYM